MGMLLLLAPGWPWRRAAVVGGDGGLVMCSSCWTLPSLLLTVRARPAVLVLFLVG